MSYIFVSCYTVLAPFRNISHQLYRVFEPLLFMFLVSTKGYQQ